MIVEFAAKVGTFAGKRPIGGITVGGITVGVITVGVITVEEDKIRGGQVAGGRHRFVDVYIGRFFGDVETDEL
jgi:hypothetical protein